MKSRTRFALPLALALFLTVGSPAAQDDPAVQPATTYVLRRIPKVGDSFAYSLLIKTKLNGVDATMTSKVKTKVIKVADDGAFTEESEEADTKVKVGEQEIEVPSEGPHAQATDAKGYVTEITGKSASDANYRSNNAMSFLYPKKGVKPGDSWDIEIAANAKLGTFSAKVAYTFKTIEKIGKDDCAQVTWKYAETVGTAPMASEGQYWIRLSDGLMVRTRATIKNAPVDPSAPPADMTIEIDLVP